MPGAIVVLSAVIFFSSFTISNSIREQPQGEGNSRYEFITVNDNNIVIFDKHTGEYWRKFIESNEGPTEWEKEESPDLDW